MNFLLFVIIIILASMLWGTGVVFGTLLGAIVLFIIAMIFMKAVSHIRSCL